MEENNGSLLVGGAKKFEKLIAYFMLVVMIVILSFAAIDIIKLVYEHIIGEPMFVLNVDELLDLFGELMLMLIGLEFLETIVKVYIVDGYKHYEVVLSVAMIAIARKVIILDVKHLDGMTLIGIAAIILAIAVSFYIIKRGIALAQDKQA